MDCEPSLCRNLDLGGAVLVTSLLRIKGRRGTA
jgi:hypothetical protein